MIKRTKLTRLFVKVDRAGYIESISLCAVNPIILNSFFKVTHTSRKNIVEWIRKWTNEDFNWIIDYTEYYHLNLLKELVIDKYKKIYPHIYYNNAIDDNTWIRVWISEKMGREIRRHDKPEYNRIFNAYSDYRC